MFGTCFLSVFFHVLFCFSYYCSLATVKIYFLSFSCFLCLISLSVSLTTVLPLFTCSILVSALFLFDSTYFSFYFLCNLCFYSFPFFIVCDSTLFHFLSPWKLYFLLFFMKTLFSSVFHEDSIFFCISWKLVFYLCLMKTLFLFVLTLLFEWIFFIFWFLSLWIFVNNF